MARKKIKSTLAEGKIRPMWGGRGRPGEGKEDNENDACDNTVEFHPFWTPPGYESHKHMEIVCNSQHTVIKLRKHVYHLSMI